MVKKKSAYFLSSVLVGIFTLLTIVFTIQQYSHQRASFNYHILNRTSQILLKSDLKPATLKLLRYGSIEQIVVWDEDNNLMSSSSDSVSKKISFDKSWRSGDFTYIQDVDNSELWVNGVIHGHLYGFIINPKLNGISFLTCLWDAIILSFWLSLLLAAASFIFLLNQRAPLKKKYSELLDHFISQQSYIRELFSQSEKLNRSYDNQVTHLQTLDGDIEEVATITKNNADKTLEANQISDDISTSTSMGTVTVQTLSQSMENISASMEKTTTIIKAIDEIAFQTNILAVNASVEAARAGQAGSGFAVVADEVRRLAMRTTVAARETSDILDQAKTFVSNGLKVTDEVSEVFHQIDSKTVTVYKILSKLTGTVEEQQARMNEITRKINLASQSSNQASGALNEINMTLQNDIDKFDRYAIIIQELNDQISLSKDEIVLLKTKVEDTKKSIRNWSDTRLESIKKLTSKKSS